MDPRELATTITDLETRMDRLKALYEQWFQGIDRLEPTVQRKDVDRRLHLLRKEQIRNTALRFRFNQLLQKYNTYVMYWGRTARQIEEGTYRRDLLRMRRRREEARGLRSERRQGYEEIDLESMEAEEIGAGLDRVEESPPGQSHKPPPPPVGRVSEPGTVQPAHSPPRQPPPRPAVGAREGTGVRPPPPPMGAPPRPQQPSASASDSLSEEHMQRIYRRYVEARQRNNERVDNVRYETVARTIKQMVPKFQAKHSGKSIDFDVVVVNGRVGLKPIPK
jgi:hypothetical protein